MRRRKPVRTEVAVGNQSLTEVEKRQIESRIRMELRGKRYRVDTKAPLP